MQAYITQMQNNIETATRPPRRQKRNPNQLKYCHTHGAFNHESPECRSKAEGHKDEATF